MEILGIVLAILSFGATCFKAGYSLGRDIEKNAKKKPPSPRKTSGYFLIHIFEGQAVYRWHFSYL